MDQDLPIDVIVNVESPHVVHYGLFIKQQGEPDFTKFAGGTDQDAGTPHSVGPVRPGSTVGGVIDVVGGAQTAYRIRLSCHQGGSPIPGASTTVTGTTDAEGVDSQRGKVVLP